MTGPNLALNNGYTIPQLGFGVFKIVPGETAAAVREALPPGGTVKISGAPLNHNAGRG